MNPPPSYLSLSCASTAQILHAAFLLFGNQNLKMPNSARGKAICGFGIKDVWLQRSIASGLFRKPFPSLLIVALWMYQSQGIDLLGYPQRQSVKFYVTWRRVPEGRGHAPHSTQALRMWVLQGDVLPCHLLGGMQGNILGECPPQNMRRSHAPFLPKPIVLNHSPW